MARSLEQPRWRNYAMQGTMWVVLAATLCAAELVGRHKRADGIGLLGEVVTMGSVRVPIPVGWKLDAGSNSSAVVARPAGSLKERGVTPRLDITVSTQLIAGLRQAFGYDRPQVGQATEEIAVGPVNGILTMGQRTVWVGATALRATDLLVQAELPDGAVLTLEMTDPMAGDLADNIKLIRAIADNVQMVQSPDTGE
jgi:hypothetical protein